nr:hypothetical protein [uncultured Acetatifactor sp.]
MEKPEEGIGKIGLWKKQLEGVWEIGPWRRLGKGSGKYAWGET